MSITSTKEGKGKYLCDICGNPIILDALKTNINPFIVKGIDKLFHVHDRCKPALRKAGKAKNWRLLPDGNLKEAYYEACKEQSIPT